MAALPAVYFTAIAAAVLADAAQHYETTVRMDGGPMSARWGQGGPGGNMSDDGMTDDGAAAPTELGAGGLLLPPRSAVSTAGWLSGCHAATGSPDCDLHVDITRAHWRPGAIATLAVLVVQALKRLGWLPGLWLARAASTAKTAVTARPSSAPPPSSSSAPPVSTPACMAMPPLPLDGGSRRSSVSVVTAPVYETLAVAAAAAAVSVAGIAHLTIDAAVDVVWPAVRLAGRLSLTRADDPFDGAMLDGLDADCPVELLRGPSGVASPAAWHSPGQCTSWEPETADPLLSLRFQFPEASAAGTLSAV